MTDKETIVGLRDLKSVLEGKLSERAGKIGGWIVCLKFGFLWWRLGWTVVVTVGVCNGVEATAILDEEIKNMTEWVFHLDVNVTLGDGRGWTSKSKIFHH